MKHLKTFEKINDKPKEGDYIQIFLTLVNDDFIDITNFLNENIGQISYAINDDDHIITYNSIPNELKHWFRKNGSSFEITISLYNVNYIIGKTPEEIELKKSISKYNL